MKKKFTLKGNCIGLLFQVLCMFIFTNIGFSQNAQTLTGRVVDETNSPLNGVSIIEKGSGNGTTTNNAGNFSISAGDTSTLVISYTGKVTQEISVGNQSSFSITMYEENKTLNDVVVVGYGTQKKVNVIGSVVTISNKELTASPVSNISNALAGRLPGAIIQQSNGEPGNDGASILIRGTATLGNNAPLIVIDGILDRDINSINSNDVESISVLKDASAAIYGARAANGVILITTKQGRDNAPISVDYNMYYGWLTPTNLPEMADAASYASMIREMQTYSGVAEPNMKFSEEDIEKYRSGDYPWTHPNTDWFDAALEKYSHTQSHNVSVNGGSNAVNYYVSFGTQQDDGIFKNNATTFNRYNIKATVDAKVNEYLTLGLILTAHRKTGTTLLDAGFNFEGAIKSLPTSPAYYPNGLPGPDIAYGQNPVVSSTDQTGFDN